jgi:hypothetical protein
MSLPPPNLAPPTPGEMPQVNLGPPSTPPSAVGGQPALEYRAVLMSQIREQLMTDTIRALLAKRGSNQTLSTEEQQQLQAWEDTVQAEFSRQIGVAVPDAVQRRLEAIDKLGQEKDAGKKSGGSGGGGGAKKGGAGGGAAAGRPPAGGAARPTTGGAPRPTTGPKPPTAPKPPGATTTTAASAASAADTLRNIRAAAYYVINRSKKPGEKKTVPDDEMVRATAKGITDLLKQPNAQPQAGNAEHAVGQMALKFLARKALLEQAQADPKSISKEDQKVLADAGLLLRNTQTGEIAIRISDTDEGRAKLAAYMEKDEADPNHPINLWTTRWMGSVAAGEDVPLAAALNQELTTLGSPRAGTTATGQPTGAAQTTGAPVTTGVLTDDMPRETWEATAKAAWEGQRRLDELRADGVQSVNPNGLDQQFIDTWINWYKSERDAGRPPQLEHIRDLVPDAGAPPGTTVPTTGAPQLPTEGEVAGLVVEEFEGPEGEALAVVQLPDGSTQVVRRELGEPDSSLLLKATQQESGEAQAPLQLGEAAPTESDITYDVEGGTTVATVNVDGTPERVEVWEGATPEDLRTVAQAQRSESQGEIPDLGVPEQPEITGEVPDPTEELAEYQGEISEPDTDQEQARLDAEREMDEGRTLNSENFNEEQARIDAKLTGYEPVFEGGWEIPDEIKQASDEELIYKALGEEPDEVVPEPEEIDVDDDDAVDDDYDDEDEDEEEEEEEDDWEEDEDEDEDEEDEEDEDEDEEDEDEEDDEEDEDEEWEGWWGEEDDEEDAEDGEIWA